MVAGIKTNPWLLPIGTIILLMVLFGGFLVDMFVLNLNTVQHIRQQENPIGNTEEINTLTSWGNCRQKHQIGREYLLANQFDLALEPLQDGAVCSNDP